MAHMGLLLRITGFFKNMLLRRASTSRGIHGLIGLVVQAQLNKIHCRRVVVEAIVSLSSYWHACCFTADAAQGSDQKSSAEETAACQPTARQRKRVVQTLKELP